MADLRESVIIKLDASGNGTAKIGPLSDREIWYPAEASVHANSNPTNEASCKLYTGDQNTMRFRDQTFTGSTGDSSDMVTGKLRHSEFVWAVWTGGDPNQYATLTVTGTKTV